MRTSEHWRRMHRNLWLVVAVLGVAAILVLVSGRSGPGRPDAEGERFCVTGPRGLVSSGDCRDTFSRPLRPQRGPSGRLREEVSPGSVTSVEGCLRATHALIRM